MSYTAPAIPNSPPYGTGASIMLRLSQLQASDMALQFVAMRVMSELNTLLPDECAGRGPKLRTIVLEMIDFFTSHGLTSERGLVRICALELLAGPSITRDPSLVSSLKTGDESAVDELYEMIAGNSLPAGTADTP